jgi:hypothetical protein
MQSVAAFCALLVSVSNARGQAVSSADSTRGYWLGASLGVAALSPLLHANGAAVGTLAFDIQRGAWLTSARFHSLGLGIGDDVRSYSVLIGRARTENFAFSAISLGPTAVWRRTCTGGCGLFGDTQREVGPAKGAVGVMLAGDVDFRADGAGIGMTSFVDLNTARSFAGFGLELTLGKWR